MAMQVTKPEGPDNQRAFNPERDMIWAMPRLIRRAFELLGKDWTVEHFTKMLEDRSTACAQPALTIDPSLEVIQGIAKMFNLMRDFPHMVEEHAAEYKRLKELDPTFHMLMGSLLMDAIFAELPLWFDQVRPTSKLSPMPNTEEIEAAADEFLKQTGGQ
jgi:hypothetical protein